MDFICTPRERERHTQLIRASNPRTPRARTGGGGQVKIGRSESGETGEAGRGATIYPEGYYPAKLLRGRYESARLGEEKANNGKVRHVCVPINSPAPAGQS